MSLSLLALKIVAPAVAKTLLESFGIDYKLSNNLLEQAIDTGTDGLVSSLESRKTLTQKTDQLAKQLKKDIEPLFESEARNLESGSRAAILFGVAETLIKARLTSDTLAEINFDAEKLKRHLLNANPEATRFFSQNEAALYQQSIAIVSQRLIEIAPEIQGFQLSTVSTTLQRLEEIAEQLKAEREQAIQAADEFATRYRHIVEDELDRLEVFGLPRMDRLTSRQSLSMAYITLSVSGAHESEKSPLTLMDDERSEREPGRKLRRIDEVICDCRRLVIRGGAGAGKSTLLQWLAVRAATQSFPKELQHWNYKIPFFIRLRSLVGGKFPTPETFPQFIAPNFIATMPSDWVHRYLNRGQALVLIDGVDELPRQERQGFFEALKDLVRDFHEATYIVTSRPSGLKDAQGEDWQEWEDWVEKQGFVNLTLEPMSTANVEDFVTRWHSALPTDNSSSTQPDDPAQTAENLKRQLRQRAELRRLASTPLLCAMICALHRERRETLPNARLELYRECIDMLLNRRDTGRKIPLDSTYPIGLNESQKIELLQSLALKLMRLNRSDLEVERVDSHFETELKKTSLPEVITGRQIRDLFVDRAALLREPAVGQIDFAHRTFQEYLAAKAALDDDSLEELLQRVMDDQWRESIIVAAGLARPKERIKLLNSLIEEGNNDSEAKHYLHLLAVACLETATTIDPATRGHVLSCAKKLLPPQNNDEIMMVARAGNEVVPLLKYEPHYSTEEACNCINTLVQIGTNTAMQTLVNFAKAASASTHDEKLIGSAIGWGWNVFDQSIYLSNVLTHLKILDLGETQISSLSSLKILTQLVGLSLNETSVVDLSPLSDLTQLSFLDLSETQVTDLSPLSGLTQLQELNLSETQVTDLSPLSGLTQLQELSLIGTRTTNLSALSDLAQLSFLDLSDTQITDVSPIGGLKQLRFLDLSGTWVTDLSPISGLTQLYQLYLFRVQVTDLSPISSLTQLSYLYLSRTQVTDLSPISSLTQLSYLYLSGTQVTDLSPLSNLTQLNRLYLSGTQVTDLSPLSNLTQLNHLDLSGTQVTDLSPLSNLTQLNHLDLSGTQVTDLSPLNGLAELKALNLSGSLVDDVSPISHLSNLQNITTAKAK